MQYRPVVTFDPNNLEHRHDVYLLVKHQTLSACKNKYTLQGNYGDTSSMMLDKISKYYLQREFELEKDLG